MSAYFEKGGEFANIEYKQDLSDVNLGDPEDSQRQHWRITNSKMA